MRRFFVAFAVLPCLLSEFLKKKREKEEDSKNTVLLNAAPYTMIVIYIFI